MFERKKDPYNQKMQKKKKICDFFFVSCMLSSYKNVPGIFCGLFRSANWLGKNIVKPLGNVADFAALQTCKRKQQPLWARIILLMAIKGE